MCSVCGAINGHLPQCPEAPEPHLTGTERCAYCGEWIHDGDSVWFSGSGECYHQACFEDNVWEILESKYGFVYGEIYGT